MMEVNYCVGVRKMDTFSEESTEALRSSAPNKTENLCLKSVNMSNFFVSPTLFLNFDLKEMFKATNPNNL